MKSLIAWSVNNWQAMNVVMVGVLLLGAFSLSQLRRDFWPDFELYVLSISVEYPGASPDEIEEGILEKIEEAVRTVDGVDEMTSLAREGMGTVTLELDPDANQADAQRVLTEVTTLIGQIPSFPELAEKPDIRMNTNFVTAIRVAVMGPKVPEFSDFAGKDELDSDDVNRGRQFDHAEAKAEAALALRRVAEQIREEILALPSVSVADLVGTPDYQIDIEIPEDTLRKYNLSLQSVAQIVRANNVELPGGTLRGRSQEVLLRGSDKSSVGSGIKEIPLVSQPGGAVLTVGDLGRVRDEFSVEGSINEVNGYPAVLVSIETTSADDLIQVADDVRQFVADGSDALPNGYSLIAMRDRSTSVKNRLDLLSKNAWMGLVLVFIVLALFLEMRLAWWVMLGIPISLLGACIYMHFGGQTLNMTSMFAFLIALGIVVDDAIVVGENIYAHREMGKSYHQAAIDGAYEVMPSVITAILTTVIAFAPIMYMEGRIKRLTVVLPMCVGAMLIISMFESLTILPSHLSHKRSRFLDVVTYFLMPLRPLAWLLQKANAGMSKLLTKCIDRIYTPILGWSLRNPAVVLSTLAGLLILSVGVVRSGMVPFLLLPKIDFGFITVQVTYPDGTPVEITNAATKRLEDAIWKVNQRSIDEKMTADPGGFVQAVQRTVGSSGDEVGSSVAGHVGGLFIQLNDIGERTVSSDDIVRMWREESGRFPGAEAVAFGATPRGPASLPIELRLMATGENLAMLDAAIERCKAKLGEYPYVSDIATDTRQGKWEYRIKVRDDAKAMGVSLADVAGTVRASYYGEEVMRLQRGRHEVPLRVRYPREDRNTLVSFNDIRVRGTDRMERPLNEIVEVDVQRGYSEISRVNQMRSISVVADVDETRGNAFNVVSDLKANFVPEFRKEFPGVQLQWGGQQEQTDETVNSLVVGFVFVLGAMFLLLTIQFNSSWQAILILSIIPFGFIGAILGHIVMNIDLTLFSIFGIVALAGVVVNDSIVLVDFINRRVADGLPLHEAIIDGGRRRFRAVLLTSVTTCAGMMPILLERSKEAQVVSPMATSLTFGLALSTLVVLILAPVMYLVVAKLSPPQ
ncbi:RND transporter, HAE1/HME family, permease protein [Rhodopirellula baltica SH28]|uniref:RND transporter, HAE1/HME family, permease protein n=1 Tax=Rhodopirellula baltica SH28 TaxID=993517 RepID=K5D9I4_RHOBT|nr:efflux RND transporter permease subunit [Rhodopirellula baltica]EKK03397.1 RND transporter, HAE1/HME family, permease protein [Rhodopirellula baltica SH28]